VYPVFPVEMVKDELVSTLKQKMLSRVSFEGKTAQIYSFEGALLTVGFNSTKRITSWLA